MFCNALLNTKKGSHSGAMPFGVCVGELRIGRKKVSISKQDEKRLPKKKKATSAILPRHSSGCLKSGCCAN